jgi:hypothetical protein
MWHLNSVSINAVPLFKILGYHKLAQADDKFQAYHVPLMSGGVFDVRAKYHHCWQSFNCWLTLRNDADESHTYLKQKRSH